MNFKEQATALENYILEQRHWLHAHPELGTKEFKTTEHIAAELAAMGIELLTILPAASARLRAHTPVKQLCCAPISTHCRYRRKTIAASARRTTA